VPQIGPDSAFSTAGGGEFAVSAETPRQDGDRSPSLVVTTEPDWQRVELIRRIGCILDDGSLLAIGAARPRESAGHGDEALSAALADGSGEAVEIGEVRLTTEYDPAGEPRRLGIELLPVDEEAPPIRGAGTLRDPGVFNFALDGSPGVARYEIARHA
jgi:hypothetical protein